MRFLLILSLLNLTYLSAASVNSDLEIQAFKAITSRQALKLKPVKNSCNIPTVSEFLSLGAKTDILENKENSYQLECRNENGQDQCRFTFSVKGQEEGPAANLPYSYVLAFNFNKSKNSIPPKSLECFTVP